MLIETFPSDIINIILLYSDNAAIIALQNYPKIGKLLKQLTILSGEIENINKNNYQYITKLNCNNYHGITDEVLQELVNLTELDCKVLCVEFNGKDIQKYIDYATKFGMVLSHQNPENLIFLK